MGVNIAGRWIAKYERDPDPEAPAGGASSTVRDMARWLRLQLGGGKFNGQQLIAAEALAETHRPQIVNTVPQNPATDRAGFYGLGWGVAYDDHGRVRVSHSGAFSAGAATQVALLPAEGLGMVVLTNAAPIGVPESVSASFFDLMLTGNVQRDWLEVYRQAFDAYLKGLFGGGTDYSRPPAQKSPPLSAAAYVGTYHNDFFGDIEVSTAGTDGGLVLQLGPKKIAYPLQHFDRDLFVYQPAGEAAGGASGVAFRVGPDQKATSVLIEELDTPSNGQGTFARVPAGN